MSNTLLIVREDILFYAFRYAIGRNTYAPMIVVDNIKANIDQIKTTTLYQLIKEIDEKSPDELGMECDQYTWNSLKTYLLDECENRKGDKK